MSKKSTLSKTGRSESSDPDNPPLSIAQLRLMRRVPQVKRIRWQLGLSQEDFAKRFEIPVGTVRDWEQGRSRPDRAASAYLKVIGNDPASVGRALRTHALTSARISGLAAKALQNPNSITVKEAKGLAASALARRPDKLMSRAKK